MSLIDVTQVLNSNYALAIILLILFIELSLPLIIGLPGDTLLLTAGLFAAGVGVKPGAPHISIWAVAILTPFASFLGSQFGYYIGWHFGPKLFSKPNAKYLSPSKLKEAEKWVNKYGIGKAIFIARFVPVVRHLIHILAGLVRTPAKVFTFWNVVTSLVWTQFFIWLGFFAGRTWGHTIEKFLTPIIVIIAAITLAPIALQIVKEYRSRKHLS